VSRVAASGGKAIAIQADVSKPVEVRRLFDAAEQALGQLDIVVATAGVRISKPLMENSQKG
jgi:3-oxoacyl-[acyl-carrier protein] reductase